MSGLIVISKISSDKFDPLIMNRKVENLLPYCHHHHHLSDSALRYLLITLGPVINISSPHTHCTILLTPYCRLNAGRRGKLLLFMFSIRSHNMLCCVTLSRVITLYKQYHTHPGPHKRQTKTAPPGDESQMKVIKTCYIINVLC